MVATASSDASREGRISSEPPVVPTGSRSMRRWNAMPSSVGPGPRVQAQRTAVGPLSRVSAGAPGSADHAGHMSDFASVIRLSVSAADEQALDTRIAVLSAAFPAGTLVTVTRGTVFNRHGMPPSPAAL